MWVISSCFMLLCRTVSESNKRLDCRLERARIPEKGFEQTAALSHWGILQCLEDHPTRGEIKVKTKTLSTLAEYI